MIDHNSLRTITLAIAMVALLSACQPTVKKSSAQDEAALEAAAAASAAQAAAAVAVAAQQSHAYGTSAEALITNHPLQVPGVLTPQVKMTPAQSVATTRLNSTKMISIENARAIHIAPANSAANGKP